MRSGSASRQAVLFICAAILTPHHAWVAAFFWAGLAWSLWLPGRGRLRARQLLMPKKLGPAPVAPATVSATSLGLDTSGIFASSLRWEEIVEVSLSAEANLWGDPWVGAYDDLTWVVRSASRTIFIDQTPANDEVLTSAFAQHLPGWSFSLDPAMLGRLANPQNEGEHLCWKRVESGLGPLDPRELR